MTLETVTRVHLAKDIGLLNASSQINEGTIANLLRAPLARWGLSPKRAILKSARDQLRAAGIDDLTNVLTVLQRLMTLGECSEVYVGNEAYLAPAEPRWAHVGGGVAAFLGVSDLPKGMSHVSTDNHRDIVRRIRIASEEDEARLHVAGVREVSMREWFTPVDYRRYASRRMCRPVKSDTLPLGGFWEMLELTLGEEGFLLSEDAEVRAVTGTPGKFFGRRDAILPEGRWSAAVPDGVWCAVRRGYGDTHWHPTIVAVDGQERRAMDLYDFDEWRWALMARGKKVGLEEAVLTEPGRVRLTFPLPTQLVAAMDLLGPSVSPWEWAVSPGAPDLLALVE